jgi:hypothetical protein
MSKIDSGTKITSDPFVVRKLSAIPSSGMNDYLL